MNTNQLARLFGLVSVWERIPLLLAAEARGDDTEYRRLFDSSPLKTWHFSEHLLAEQALHVLALIYVTEQLDAAAVYFFAPWQPDSPDPDWLLMADAAAYFFVANADAWRRFCQGLGIDSAALTAGNYRGWFLPFCERRMPANAPSTEAVQARFREAGRDAPRLVTADTLLASWQSLLQSMNRHAPRVKP